MFSVQEVGFVEDLGCRVQSVGHRVRQDVGFRVFGSGCWLSGSAIRVKGVVFAGSGLGV